MQLLKIETEIALSYDGTKLEVAKKQNRKAYAYWGSEARRLGLILITFEGFDSAFLKYEPQCDRQRYEDEYYVLVPVQGYKPESVFDHPSEKKADKE